MISPSICIGGLTEMDQGAHRTIYAAYFSTVCGRAGGCVRGRRQLDLLRLQVAVDPLPPMQLCAVGMARPEDPAEVREDPGLEFLCVGFASRLVQSDGQVRFADEGVRVITAEGLAQQRDGLALQRLGGFLSLPRRLGSWPG